MILITWTNFLIDARGQCGACARYVKSVVHLLQLDGLSRRLANFPERCKVLPIADVGHAARMFLIAKFFYLMPKKSLAFELFGGSTTKAKAPRDSATKG